MAVFLCCTTQLIAQPCVDPLLYAPNCDLDGDGVLNEVDIDDDNDGVLDIDEMDCQGGSNLNLTDGLATGDHNMDTWLLLHGIRIRHVETTNFTANTTTFRVINHPSWVQHGDPDGKLIWNGTGVSISYFAPDGITPQTTNTFSIWSDPIPIVGGTIRIIARDINGNTLVDRLDADGTLHHVDLSHTGGVPIHELVFANSSSAVDGGSLAGICTSRDTDNDLIADHQDLDADGDGCSDAYEAGATTDSTANFQFSDVVGDPDGLSNSVDVGEDGIPDYVSTYNLFALDITQISCPVVLATGLKQFQVRLNGQLKVVLDWEIDDAQENMDFVVERSVVGKSWEQLATILADGRSYKWIDSDPIYGLAYYRLKLLDNDGKASYSQVEAVMNYQEKKLNVFPNPFEDLLIVEGTPMDLVHIKVLNLQGQEMQVLREKEVSQARIKLDLSNLNPGIYFIKTLRETRKVIKH